MLEGDGPALQVGDWILIHVGFALCRIDEKEAEATLRLLDSVAYTDELKALEKSDIR